MTRRGNAASCMVQSSTQRDARRVQLQAIGRLIVIAVLVTFITVAALMRIESMLLDGVLESTTRQPFSASPPFPPASGRRRPPRPRVDRHARGIQRQLPPACRDGRHSHWRLQHGHGRLHRGVLHPHHKRRRRTALPDQRRRACPGPPRHTSRKNFLVRCVTLLEPRQRHTSR